MARGRPRNTTFDADTSPNEGGANVGYEAQLWQMADALRGSMDAAEYKHVVLGLIFLKYISDAFEEQRVKLVADQAKGADPEDPDEYRALSIFWVPPEARWAHLKAQARQSTVGQLVDDAMAGIEHDNPALERAAEGLRPPRARQDATWSAHRPRQQHQGRGQGFPCQGRARPRLRVFPLPVRQCRGGIARATEDEPKPPWRVEALRQPSAEEDALQRRMEALRQLLTEEDALRRRMEALRQLLTEEDGGRSPKQKTQRGRKEKRGIAGLTHRKDHQHRAAITEALSCSSVCVDDTKFAEVPLASASTRC
jgi:hypothetical protein